MLVEALLVVGALNVVKPAGVAAVMAGIDASLGVDLDTECVTASFGKHFVAAGFGVISPDQLSHGVLRFFAGIKPGRVTWPVTVDPCAA